MIRRAAHYPGLYQKKTVVLFAGAGGSCMGIEEAYCAGGLDQGVDVAINHDADAIACHKRNHPLTEHFECDVFEVDPETVEGPIGLLWGSPDCTDFSKAKGGRPIRTVKRRSLAWALVHWAFVKQPDCIMLENVEEFEQWGPLDHEGRPVRDGSTFRIWVRCLRYLGYEVDWRTLRACDYGTPTTRQRLYVIARCDGKPIVWPEKTHGDMAVEGAGASDGRHDTGDDDRHRKCGRRSKCRGGAERHAPDTPARDGAQRASTAPGHDQPHRHDRRLKPYVPAAACIDFDRPMCSIFATPDEARDWAKRHGLPTPRRPLAHNTCDRMARGIRRYVIEAEQPFIVRQGHYSARTGEGRHFRGQSVEQPLSTVTAGYHDKALVDAKLAPLQVGAGGPTYAGEPRRLDRPGGTVLAKNHGALAAAVLARTGNTGAHGDYVNSPDEPARTVTTCHDQQLVAAHLTKHHTGVVGQDLRKPCPTVKGVDGNGLAVAHLSHMYTSNTAGGQGDLRQPKKTVLAGANHASLIAALLAPYYGSGSGLTGRDVRDPLPTIPATDRHQLVTAALERGGTDEFPVGFWRVWRFLIEHLGPNAPPPIVWLDGEPWLIVDICMRMLAPRELARCQGFRDDYVIDEGHDGQRLSNRVQVRLIGNSVCRQVARALVRANVVEQDVMWMQAGPASAAELELEEVTA